MLSKLVVVGETVVKIPYLGVEGTLDPTPP
jgi:hypothetical protein